MKIDTALILCAGLGKRLNPLTLKTPKPLLKLNDVTILESCIDIIIKTGFKTKWDLDRGIKELIKGYVILNNSNFSNI